MKLEYDPEVDAAYLTLSEAPVVDSEELKPGIVVDYDAQNRIVGIEVLNVRRQLPDADLKRLQVEVA
jgi:uncharacterized protein YuzE